MPNAEMNSWPKKAKVQSNCEIFRQSFSQGPYPPIYQQSRNGFIYFITLQIISQGAPGSYSCIFCGFFCVSLSRIVNRLFDFTVTGFCKKSILLFSMTKQKFSLNACLFLCLYSVKIKSDNFVSVSKSSNESLKKLLGGL